MRAFLLLALLAVSLATAQDSDACGQWPTCVTCLENPFCGWCSAPVTYKDGTTGKQCAGFNPATPSEPFVCSGTYSTEKCIVGYDCDNVTFTCKIAAPGQGVPLPQCLGQCKNDGLTYLCNHTTMTCAVTTPGSGTSLQVCQQQCSTPGPTSSGGPTGSPGPTASPTPAPTAALTYLCNHTSWQCYATTPGSGTSKDLCDAQCVKPTPSNNTPVFLLGLWRGIQVNTGYTKGEYSILFNTSTATFVNPDKTTIYANVQSIAQEVWLVITSPSTLAGHIMKGVYKPNPNGPEVRWLELAFGALDADAPDSYLAAMTNPADKALWLSQCLTPACVFHLSNTQSLFERPGPSGDYCHDYGDNCTYCISHKYCGWCSTAVQYQDGTTGNQCAGFNPNTTKQPFTCTGSYSTEICTVGYQCNGTTGTCDMAQPGDGVPMAQCMTGCVAPMQGYRCDNVTKTCIPDKSGGAKDLCAAYCQVTPQPGPPSIIVGTWRGLEIKKGYTVGEFDLVFNASTVTLIANGVVKFVATVQSQGPMLNLTITQGLDVGKTLLVMYQFVGAQIFNMATMAFGQPDGLIPATFDESMGTPGETEFVMAKCLDPTTCNFSA